jgi:homopolymeric O-antigen transport system ATP-binding protein
VQFVYFGEHVTAIKFDNVSKKYKLYSKGGLYLRDRVTHAIQRLNPFNDAHKPVPGIPHSLERQFMALKNVSFAIKKGEAVGFVGRNGAGKSTILKLLAGVTKASSGQVNVKGKVAALIEVGAGFHPELTGRENIYLNGSILGMKKTEIEKHFDGIVSFAELEKFIDTPVKHYSSGMYVRLGFAVAAHTNPEIFLIDEVLAVGDEGFQRKCLRMLAAHKAAGKTMILVSHQLNRIEDVCDRCIYMDRGELLFDGSTRQAIVRYRDDLVQGDAHNKQESIATLGWKAQILEVKFRDYQGANRATFESGEDVIIEIHYRCKQRIVNPVVSLGIYGPNGEHVAGFSTQSSPFIINVLEPHGIINCRLNEVPLLSGFYSVSVEFSDSYGAEIYDYHNRQYRFEIKCEAKHVAGILRVDPEWSYHLTVQQASVG